MEGWENFVRRQLLEVQQDLQQVTFPDGTQLEKFCTQIDELKGELGRQWVPLQIDRGGTGDCLFLAVLHQLQLNGLYEGGITEGARAKGQALKLRKRVVTFERANKQLKTAVKVSTEVPKGNPQDLQESDPMIRKRMNEALADQTETVKDRIEELFRCDFRVYPSGVRILPIMESLLSRGGYFRSKSIRAETGLETHKMTVPQQVLQSIHEMLLDGTCVRQFLDFFAGLNVEMSNDNKTIKLSVRDKGQLRAAITALQRFNEVGGKQDIEGWEATDDTVTIQSLKDVTTGSPEGKDQVALMAKENTWAAELEIVLLERKLAYEIVVEYAEGGIRRGEITHHMRPSDLDPTDGESVAQGARGHADDSYAPKDGVHPRIFIYNIGNYHFVSSNYRHSLHSDALDERLSEFAQIRTR